jgi:hypothetical protein
MLKWMRLNVTLYADSQFLKVSIFGKRTADVVCRGRKLFESHLQNNDVLQMQSTSYKILEFEIYIKYNPQYLSVRYGLWLEMTADRRV